MTSDEFELLLAIIFQPKLFDTKELDNNSVSDAFVVSVNKIDCICHSLIIVVHVYAFCKFSNRAFLSV
ncbi:hypothetical protein HOB94_01025 [bacterium]|nr:hypothetical protein [bacterium]